MHTFTFKMEYKKDDSDPGHEVLLISKDAVTLGDIIPYFEQFLKGCGYIFPEGVHLGYEED